jgi:hypothetical protein
MAVKQVGKKSKQHGGYKTVIYRDTRGRSFLCKVASAGTGSTLNLYIIDRDRRTIANRSLTNVPLATSMKSTNAYFNITA